jgi:lipopolysaccharide heptosyltransferase II
MASPLAPLLKGHPALNRVIPFDRKRFARMPVQPAALRDFLRFLRELRAARYDLVVDLQGLFRSGFFSAATGARARLGFRDAREAAWVFYTHRLPKRKSAMHAVDRNYLVAEALGFQGVPVTFELALNEHDQITAERLLHAAGLTPDAPWTAVVPGARWETKAWAPERFAELIDELQTVDRRACVLLGLPDEASVCRWIADRCRARPADLSGRTGLREFAALLSRAEMVVGHDSAAVHLAAALDRPLVCIVGPTNPDLTGPYRQPECVVRQPPPCSPCHLRSLQKCAHDHRCMKELPTSAVLTAIRRQSRGVGKISLAFYAGA